MNTYRVPELEEVYNAVETELEEWSKESTYDAYFRDAKKRALHQFFTPPALSVYMAHLLYKDATVEHCTILDPTCGDGNLLVASYYLFIYKA
jgi:type I restriction-modification system DNA methylase subunit